MIIHTDHVSEVLLHLQCLVLKLLFTLSGSLDGPIKLGQLHLGGEEGGEREVMSRGERREGVSREEREKSV